MNPIFLLIGPALAQEGLDGHHFYPAPAYGDLLDPVETWRIAGQEGRSFGIQGLVDTSSGGVVQVQEDWTGSAETQLLSRVTAFNVGVRAALHPRLDLAVSAPLYLASSGVDGPQGVGVGDVRLAAPVGLALPGGAGVSAGLVPLLDLPTGDESALLGSGGVGGGGLAALGWRGYRFAADLNAGYSHRPSIAFENQTGGGRLVAAASAGVTLTEGLGAGAELLHERPLSRNEVPGTDSPTEALLHLRGRTAGLGWTLGGGAGLGEGVGAPAWRAFAGVTWARLAAPDRDSDGDGILGQSDGCPSQPEVANGWRDADGCPDALASLSLRVVDEEGTPLDGALVTIDGSAYDPAPDGAVQVPARPPDAPLAVSAAAAGYAEGRLEAPALEEGPSQRTLTLAWLPGTVRVNARDTAGKPVDAEVTFQGPAAAAPLALGPQGQAQAVLPGGEWRALIAAEGYGPEARVVRIDPDKPGLTRIDVVLAPPRVAVEGREVTILEAIPFDTGMAEIRPDSEPLLRQVAGQLLAHPELAQVEIQGYTDDVGDTAYNLDLSQQRVEAVRQWLVANGVPPERLLARGYGEARPVASNGTEAGRAANRRVQFQVVRVAQAAN